MNHLYTFLALDLARERARDATEARRAATIAAGAHGRPNALRRGLAMSLAAVSRASADAAHRLDDRVAHEHDGGSSRRSLGCRHDRPIDIPRGTAAVSWGPGRIDLFTVDEDAGLVHRVFMSGTWSEPESLGGTLASAPAATAWGVDELQVFAVFTDGQLWNRYWDGTSWHPWEPMGGELVGTARGIVVERRPDRRLRARPRRARLASLVGRHALGRVGAAARRDRRRSAPSDCCCVAGATRTATPYVAMNQDPAVMEHMQGLQSRRGQRRVHRQGRGATGTSTAGGCGRSRSRASRRSSASPGCGRRPTSWLRVARDRLAAGPASTGATAMRPRRPARRCGSGSGTSASTRSCRSPCRRTSGRGRSWSGSASNGSPMATSITPTSMPIAYPHIVRHVLYRLDRPTWEARQVSST